MLDDGWLHVAAAVIRDGRGRVLIARRPEHLHHGGRWEFPGGKVEPGEGVQEALARELVEELGIQVVASAPLIRVRHAYPERRVLLDVWEVSVFTGIPSGCEGQAVRWVEAEDLPDYGFPAANLPIVSAARLPDHYLITPEPYDHSVFLDRLESRLVAGVRLIQFRAKTLEPAPWRRLALESLRLTRQYGARLLVNAGPERVVELGADGVHLSSAQLSKLNARPLPRGLWVAASCHSTEALLHAAEIGADFAVVSPVKATATHPNATPIGWKGLRALTENSFMPVYALGGLTLADIPEARANGAQGIAAVRGLWDSDEVMR